MLSLVTPSEFPIGARVELTGLTQKEYNGKMGIVQSTLDPVTGRQQVALFVTDDDDDDDDDNNTAAAAENNNSKTSRKLGLKPINLQFVPRSMDTLSVKELKAIMTYILNHENHTTATASATASARSSKNVNSFIAGLDKKQLREMVSEKVHSDERRIAAILSHSMASSSVVSPSLSNSSRDTMTPAAVTTTTTSTVSAEQIQAQVDLLQNTSPEQLRQQAQMMRIMDPHRIRQMNPHMASFTNEQIQMAATQLEMLANNPNMMATVSQQMKHMTPQQLEQQARLFQQQPPVGGLTRNKEEEETINTTTTTTPPTTAWNPQQMQQGAQNMLQMTPQQMRQQAQTLRTMDPTLVRQMNPTMKHLSNTQIQHVITQLETMADHPELIQSMVQQMQNMTPEQWNQVQDEFNTTTTTTIMENDKMTTNNKKKKKTSIPDNNNNNLLSSFNTQQIQQMIQMVKQNPTMVKNMLRNQHPELVNTLSDTQLDQMISTFTHMDDKNIHRLLYGIGMIQSIHVKFQQHKRKLLLFLLGGMILVWILAHVWKGTSSSSPLSQQSSFLSYKKWVGKQEGVVVEEDIGYKESHTTIPLWNEETYTHCIDKEDMIKDGTISGSRCIHKRNMEVVDEFEDL